MQYAILLIMKKNASTNITLTQLNRWFYLFLFTHIIAWTLAPYLLRFTLPLDAMEGATWGQHLQWGYDKNPFMNAWLTTLALKIGGTSGWAVYLFSQISVGLCFWSVWQLGKKILPPVYAFMAVLLLEGVQHYNLHAIDFNDNTLELGLWALTVYFFYQALSNKKLLPWLLTAIFAALGMMAKYYTALLLFSMLLFLVVHKRNWQVFKNRHFYAAAIVFLIIIAPHFIWLFSHNFITVTYAFDRVSSAPSWTNHFVYPLQFAWQMLEAFIPVLVLLALTMLGKRPVLTAKPSKISYYDESFLLLTGLGPFILTLLLSVIFGMKLRAGWGMPLLTFWGLLLLVYFQLNITRALLYRFIALIFITLFLLLAGYSYALLRANSTSSAIFPGQEIAEKLTNEWHTRYHTKLAYIAGPRWLGGNIMLYSTDHPSVFMDWDLQRSSWIDIHDLERHGAIFAWQISEGEMLPLAVKQQHPQLTPLETLRFHWYRNKNLPAIEIGVVYLPPKALKLNAN